jgi:hypothetical protein
VDLLAQIMRGANRNKAMEWKLRVRRRITQTISRPTTSTKTGHGPSIVALVMIILTLLGTWVWAGRANYVPCISDCGETLIAQFDARNYRLFGSKFGLVEDHATSPDANAHPYYYTHNVNIGGLTYTLLEIIGIRPFWSRQLLVLMVFGLGLYYCYLSVAYHSRSRLFALSVLFMGCLDYAFFLSFALHPLRTWNFLVIYGLAFHVGRSTLEPTAHPFVDWLATLVLAAIAFGVGYEFWALNICIVASLVLLSVPAPALSLKNAKSYLRFAFMFAAPFVARQIHIAKVMGLDYWITDFYYSVVIKVPLVSSILPLPSIAEVDQFYLHRNVMRPPASPISSGADLVGLLDVAQRAIATSIIPAAGVIASVATLALAIGAILFVLERRVRDWAVAPYGIPPVASGKSGGSRLEGQRIVQEPIDVLGTARLVASLALGILFGGTIFFPIYVPFYLAMRFPLLGLVVVIAKGLVLTLALRLFLRSRKNRRWCSWAAFAALAVITLDHAVVQFDNVQSSKPMDTSWIPAISARADATFAVSFIAPAVAAFTNNWAIGIKPGVEREILQRLREGKEPFHRDDLFWFGERDAEEKGWSYLRPDYWLYFVTDKRIPFADPSPECREDYLTRLLAYLQPDSSEAGSPFSSYWAQPSKLRPGGRVMIGGRLLDRRPVFERIEVAIDNKPVGTLVHNCFYRTAIGDFVLPNNIQPGRHNVQVKVVFPNGKTFKMPLAQFEIDKAAPIVSLPPGPMNQPSVADVVAENPRLNIADRRVSRNNWEGYLLIDLRAAYGRQGRRSP